MPFVAQAAMQRRSSPRARMPASELGQGASHAAHTHFTPGPLHAPVDVRHCDAARKRLCTSRPQCGGPSLKEDRLQTHSYPYVLLCYLCAPGSALFLPCLRSLWLMPMLFMLPLAYSFTWGTIMGCKWGVCGSVKDCSSHESCNAVCRGEWCRALCQGVQLVLRDCRGH